MTKDERQEVVDRACDVTRDLYREAASVARTLGIDPKGEGTRFAALLDTASRAYLAETINNAVEELTDALQAPPLDNVPGKGNVTVHQSLQAIADAIRNSGG